MMKPWQTLLNKAPNKGEKQKQREREREDPSSWQKHKTPQVVTKGQRNYKLCSRAPTGLKKHIREEKGRKPASTKL
jgi:hypothetical protein